MPKLFQTPAIIDKISTLVDGGCKLSISTQELAPDEMTSLFSLKNKEGWFLFKESVIKESDVDKIPDEPDVRIEKRDKTPSQRIRAVIYRLWETTNKSKTADEFYKYYMDKLIEKIKEKL